MFKYDMILIGTYYSLLILVPFVFLIGVVSGQKELFPLIVIWAVGVGFIIAAKIRNFKRGEWKTFGFRHLSTSSKVYYFLGYIFIFLGMVYAWARYF